MYLIYFTIYHAANNKLSSLFPNVDRLTIVHNFDEFMRRIYLVNREANYLAQTPFWLK